MSLPVGLGTTIVALLASIALAAPAGARTCQGAESVPAQTTEAALRSATLCLVNAERGARQLVALHTHAMLTSVAGRYARQMVSEGFFAHTSPRGSTVLSRIRQAGYLRGAPGWSVGENLAWGDGALGAPRAIVQAWMDSPGHRANILSPCFREIGIGIAPGVPAQSGDGVGGSTYVTDFGRRSGRRCQ